MPSVTLYFRVHQPHLLHHYSSSEIDYKHIYFDTAASMNAINSLATGCYLPANKIILSLIKKFNGRFKVNYSISGSALELMKLYHPVALKSFRKLVNTGCVEILAETYYNSLSSIYNKEEFQHQVEKHDALVKELLGFEPKVFRNTELIHNNIIASQIASMGFRGILCEGLDRILNGRSVNHVYQIPGVKDCVILLRNESLSDDIAFRFGDQTWNEFPLMTEKFAGWIHAYDDEKDNINLFLDYETFGIHQTRDSGIFEFLEHLPGAILSTEQWSFSTPSHIIDISVPETTYNVPNTISWGDKMVECCVSCDNARQNNTLKKIYSLNCLVKSCGNEESLEYWRRLQAADYFYYMSHHEKRVREAYQYLNPFQSAEEAYACYTNILTDFEISLIRKGLEKCKPRIEHISAAFLY